MLFTIMNRGGAETMVMNYYRHIDRNQVQFDFMVHRQERGAYDDEYVGLLHGLGGPVRVPAPGVPGQDLLGQPPQLGVVGLEVMAIDFFQVGAFLHGVPSLSLAFQVLFIITGNGHGAQPGGYKTPGPRPYWKGNGKEWYPW